MAKKLTIEEINTRLEPKGIKIIGNYVSSSISTLLECNSGHQWKTRVANLINRGDGCPMCSGHNHTKIWTTQSINDCISERGILLTSEYPGKVGKRGSFICEKGHKWDTTIASVLRGSGCKVCHGKTIPLTMKEIRHRYEKLGYTVTGEYVNYDSILKFSCSNGHTWNTKVGNTRCSSCASFGFKLDRPSYGYILKFATFIKYGISNSIESRLYRHKKVNPPHEVILLLNFSDGKQARLWENSIKKHFGGRYVSKNECPCGYTETLAISTLPELIQKYGDSWHCKS